MKTHTLDVSLKYVVLLAFTAYIGMYLYFCFTLGKVIEFPPAILVLFTLVYQYYFRKPPLKGDNGHNKMGN